MPIISGKFELYESDDQVNKLYPQTQWTWAPRAKHYNKEIKHEGRTYLYRAKMEREAPWIEKTIKSALGYFLLGAGILLPLTYKKYSAILLLLPLASKKWRNFFFDPKEVHKCAIDSEYYVKLNFQSWVNDPNTSYITLKQQFLGYINNILNQGGEEANTLKQCLRNKFGAMKLSEMKNAAFEADRRVLGITKEDIANFVKLGAKNLTWSQFIDKYGSEALKHIPLEEIKRWHPEITKLIQSNLSNLSDIDIGVYIEIGLKDVLKNEIQVKLKKIKDLESFVSNFGTKFFRDGLLKKTDPKLCQLVSNYLKKMDAAAFKHPNNLLEYISKNELVADNIKSLITDCKKNLIAAKLDYKLFKREPARGVKEALDEEKQSLADLVAQDPDLAAKVAEYDKAQQTIETFEKQKNEEPQKREKQEQKLKDEIGALKKQLTELEKEESQLSDLDLKDLHAMADTALQQTRMAQKHLKNRRLGELDSLNINFGQRNPDIVNRISENNKQQAEVRAKIDQLTQDRFKLPPINIDALVSEMEKCGDAEISKRRLSKDLNKINEYKNKQEKISTIRKNKVEAAKNERKRQLEEASAAYHSKEKEIIDVFRLGLGYDKFSDFGGNLAFKSQEFPAHATQKAAPKVTTNMQANIQPTPQPDREPIKPQNLYNSDNLSLRSTNSNLKSKWVCPKILEDKNSDECETIKRILHGKFTLAQDNSTIYNDEGLKKVFNRSIVLMMLGLKPNVDNMDNNAEIKEKTRSLISQLKNLDAPEIAPEINEAIEYLNHIPQILSSDRPGFSICE